jgi:signal transduction histidine kinase
MNLTSAFKKQSKNWIFTEMVATILCIGYVDYLSGYSVSLFIFYGAPIFAVAWYCSKRHGILVALLAGITWWWADIMTDHPYDYNWQQAWETGVRLGFFMFVAVVGASLRAHTEMAQARIALLEHSQRLEREIISISEREQRRIGQDLHDGICQYLAALGCAAASLESDLSQRQLEAEARLAGDLAKFLQDAVIQTRDLARGLVPLQMDEAGLALALENLADSVTRLQGIPCTFACNGSLAAFDETRAMHLYRIAQEAINNATRHGKPSRIALSLQAAEGTTILSIRDDGLGISKTQQRHGGIGLSIMNYRARLSGGELQIDEPAHGGTIVSCVVANQNEDRHVEAA